MSPEQKTESTERSSIEMSLGLGSRVRKIRKEKGLSAKDLEIDKGLLSRIENDKQCPSDSIIFHLAGKLDITPSELHEDKGWNPADIPEEHRENVKRYVDKGWVSPLQLK